MAKLELRDGYQLWHYVPSMPAAIIFIILFSVTTLGHVFRMSKHRVWFGIPFVVGGLFEIVGYIGRAMAHNDTTNLTPYVMQSTLLLLAPIFFAASLYMTLSRVVIAVGGQKYSLISPRWLTCIFVFGDIVSFLIQASGAGLIVQAGSGGSGMDPNLGSNVIIGGLIFQIIVFAVFIASAVVFNRRFSPDSYNSNKVIGMKWQQTLSMLYITSAFVMVRNIFRVVEYVMGSDGYLFKVEWGVYIFDATLMTLTMAWFFWRYPHEINRASKSSGRVVSMEEFGPINVGS